METRKLMKIKAIVRKLASKSLILQIYFMNLNLCDHLS
ncbi:unnamed protein product, partial [Larinioides sclopetarius]